MDKKQRMTIIILLGIGIALLVTACLVGYLFFWRDNSPPSPPLQPTSSGDGSWAQIKSRGSMLVGVSADYPPFAYYNKQYQIDGFDPALMRSIGSQLGVSVELQDYAFEGLISAVQVGQIDAAISAITITPERQAVVDFSNVYYVGLDAVLANQNSPVTSITNTTQMAGQRIGVQAGSIYESWAKDVLVDTGLIPASNLHTYPRMDDAITDLRANLIDLVVLDLDPANAYAQSGGVKLVGQSLNPQSYAIVVRKGATELLYQINRSLATLAQQGTIDQLARQYLSLPPDQSVPTPQPPPTPLPTAVGPTPVACVDSMALVQHLNLPDNNMQNPPTLPPGQPFVKGWRIQNTGTCTWNNAYFLNYVQGSSPAAQMGGAPTPIQGAVPPGGMYDIYISLISPINPGVYQAFWQMFNNTNTPFGQRVSVGIQVSPLPTATPKPTQTPSPNIFFSADRTQINPGEPVTFNWIVQNAQSVYFYAQGQPWQDNQVSPSGSRIVYPTVTTTYELRVVSNSGTVEVRQILITVNQAPPNAPLIQRFVVQPPNQITLGQCLFIEWEISGEISSARLLKNNQALWSNAPSRGSYQDCPQQAGILVYAIEATGPGGFARQEHQVTVQEPLPSPEPTQAPPDIPPPVIDYFSATPDQLQFGECTTLSWSVGGGTERLQIMKNGAVIWDNAPFNNSAQDCPDQTGTITYSAVAIGESGEKVTREAAVQVAEAPPQNQLVGTSWRLTGYYDGVGAILAPIEGTMITLTFQPDSTLTGSSGCNTFSGPYVVTGNTLAVGELNVTKQSCTSPAGIMEQENMFLSDLRAATSFLLQGNQLLLFDNSGQLILEFTVNIQPR